MLKAPNPVARPSAVIGKCALTCMPVLQLCAVSRSAGLSSSSLVDKAPRSAQLLQPARFRRRQARCRAASEPSPVSDGPPKRTKPKGPTKEVERSVLVNEDTVYLIFQMDLDTQLQRCLNYEAYEAAQEVRIKRQRVDEAVASMRVRKAANTGDEQAAPALSSVDIASEGLRLRTEMARAAEEERYADAAKFRDLLKELEIQGKKAEAAVEEWSGGQTPRLRLGQRITHVNHGYRGVIVGWDMRCCETDEWAEAAGVAALGRGAKQPFYHVLVDSRDWEYSAAQLPVAYVAEELLTAPELDESSDKRSWVETYGNEPMQHPYMYILFLGQDARGDYIPTRQLRDRYSARRRDVYKPGQEPKEGGEEDDGDSVPFTTPD